MPESRVCSRYSVAGPGSVLSFEAKSSLHGVHGSVREVSGYVDACFEDDGSLAIEPPPKMHVEFPVERLRSGNDIQDREMWRLIDSKRFPMVSADLSGLKSTSVPGRYEADGQVTLAGRMRRYAGRLAVTRDGDHLVIEGDLVVDIRDFGLKPPQLLFIKVDPTVTVRLNLVTAAAAAA
jgi:hypothetical protein